MLISLLLAAQAMAAYSGERDPPIPEPKKQYRLILRTPGRICRDWRKATPILGKDDLIVSSTRKDEEGKTCRFLWVITPAAPVGHTKFELEPFGGGAPETFELAAPAGYQPPAPPPPGPSANIPGVANENGTGPATTPIQGRVKLPGIEPGK